MYGIKKKIGPLANFEFDKLFLGQVFSHFADAIVQFLLVAIDLPALPDNCNKIATSKNCTIASAKCENTCPKNNLSNSKFAKGPNFFLIPYILSPS